VLAIRFRLTRTIGRHHLAGASASAAVIILSSYIAALAVAGLLALILAAAAAWERLEHAGSGRRQSVERVAET
jgi:hypothetical protein